MKCTEQKAWIETYIIWAIAIRQCVVSALVDSPVPSKARVLSNKQPPPCAHTECVYTGKLSAINTFQCFPTPALRMQSLATHVCQPANQKVARRDMTDKNLAIQNIGAPTSFLNTRYVFISLEFCSKCFKILRYYIKPASTVLWYRERKQTNLVLFIFISTSSSPPPHCLLLVMNVTMEWVTPLFVIRNVSECNFGPEARYLYFG